MTAIDDDDGREIYNVVLMMHHPSERLDRITSELGMERHHGWQAGEPRSTPKGTALPGTYKDTYWGHSDEIKGHRKFFETVMELLEKLEAASEYVMNLSSSGGRISLIVHLPGHTNIGDVIKPADLMRIGRLGVELGVEVFPQMT